MTSRLSKKAQRLGFKTQEEYIVFSALKKKHLDVKHNISMFGTEIDLFIPPKIIVEIGYRDNYLLEKWDYFMEKGYGFIYISNVEVTNPEILERYATNILRLVEEMYINSYRWNVKGFASPIQKDSICFNETTDDGLNGVISCLESALREGATLVSINKKNVLNGIKHSDELLQAFANL